MYNLYRIIKNYKRVNIVTNHIEKFKKMEKEMLNEYGIMITITNNKRKSLSRSKIILNIDFPQELVEQYNIYDEAIVINLSNNVRIHKKRFNGICINNYDICWNGCENEDLENYFGRDLYEADLYERQPIKEIRRKIDNDGVKICKVFSENGVV